jgi:predicted SnoaL-like aldol condensation-catalyzing enzyme
MNDAAPEGPHERLVGRLRQLADAVTQGRDAVAREFTMRVPAEPERDADLVLSTAADELDRLRDEIEALRAALRWHIRVYRVSDEHPNPEAFADELMAKELTPNY